MGINAISILVESPALNSHLSPEPGIGLGVVSSSDALWQVLDQIKHGPVFAHFVCDTPILICLTKVLGKSEAQIKAKLKPRMESLDWKVIETKSVLCVICPGLSHLTCSFPNRQIVEQFEENKELAACIKEARLLPLG